MRIRKPILTFSLILLISAMACRLPIPGAISPTPTPTAPPANPSQSESIESLAATVEAQLSNPGPFTVVFSEQQLTDAFTDALTQERDYGFTEPKIELRDGQILLTGKMDLNLVSAAANITLEPSVNDGQLQIAIKSATVGGVPLPDNVQSEISEQANKLITKILTVKTPNLRLESVQAQDGLLTISGSNP